MNLRRAVIFAACVLPLVAGPAAAQSSAFPPAEPQAPPASAFPPAQPQQTPSSAFPPAQSAPSSAFPPAQGQSPAFSAFPPAQPQQPPPCFVQFVKLRDEAQKRAKTVQAAFAKKPSAKVACSLLGSFAAAEEKMVKYAIANATVCNIPAEILTTMKTSHAKTNTARSNACKAAAAGPPRPAGPSLSDALGAPIPDSDNIKRGRGTYDTLTGTPLGSR